MKDIEVQLTPDDIVYFLHRARQYYQETDAHARLPHQIQPMTESEFKAVAWIRAAADVMARKKLLSDNPEFRIDFPDSLPDTEY